ncbi:MAG: SDR family oxidoreductase [Rhodospirillaceae bacterium]|jgi:UDP-glucose 4-epimerase|nr:SDR family oxidoreductase [Rhodospirillaceae bacterium]MBT3492633.1 SDR family oxidoreductase [Rhodospirillaceae bacterium]MBT4565209.1 SDR family oxidoreductase [Rhodospirillaceae bacterium]MBT6259271.1 SDR family oxidoreductase [Rhodospirillaceae bacterium]MBT6474240.1 SDR family oxidoreductase [Rhodospirillaceae bacterium]
MTKLELTGDGLDVVTGGAGFIGSHLVDRLLADGRRVRAVDNFVTGGPHNLKHLAGEARFELIEADIRDRAGTKTALMGAERIFHLAALADIVPSIQNPEGYYDTNVTGTFNVLQAARDMDVRRLIYAASSSCYGIPDNYPTAEEAEIRPEYPYALTKFLGEQLVMHWSQIYGLPAASLRFFNVYGPRARTSGTYGAVFGVFLAQLLADQALTVVGDGEQTRDFTYVGDVADAVATVGGYDDSGEVFNVGTGKDVSVNRLVELLGAGEVIHIPKRPGEPDCTLADVTRINQRFGWVSQVPIEDGVRIMLDNIDYWRDAPVWDATKIAAATEDWFRYLSND